MATTKKRKTSGKAARPKRAAKAGKAKKAKAARPKATRAKAASKKPSRVKARAPKRSVAKAARRPPARKAGATAADPIRMLARRIVDVTKANDDEAAFALYASDVESLEPGQPPMRGLDAIRQKYAGWRNMVSEAHFEPRRVCVDGNTVVIEWSGDVTLAGSGHRARMHEVAIHEIRNGKIVREAYFYDPAALAPQTSPGAMEISDDPML